MLKILKLASRNLARYGRRTALTAGLIILGVVAVLLFIAVSGSFKALMIGQITDSMLGHLQVHRRGYVASIDNLPLNLNMKPGAAGKVEQALKGIDSVAAWSPQAHRSSRGPSRSASRCRARWSAGARRPTCCGCAATR